MIDLSVEIAGLRFKNPVLAASGTFGYGVEYAPFVDISKFGGVVTKTITLEPREGNPMPRIAETPAGMLNSIGLSNVGAERYRNEKLPDLENIDTIIIANIAGETVDEYARVTGKIQDHPRIDALEINISCPNVEMGGMAFGTDPEVTRQVVQAVRRETRKPVIVKLTPNVTDIGTIARAAVSGGADAISLINTVIGMGVNIETRKPLIRRVVAGLSGPAIKPVALAKLYQVRQAVSVPLIGIGGIMSWKDMVEFLLVGASAVQVGTLNFVDPGALPACLEGLIQYCLRHKIGAVRHITGKMMIEPEI